MPYWSNPSFLISDILALWRSGLSARMSEIKNAGLDQYGKVWSLNGIGGERVNNTKNRSANADFTPLRVWNVKHASFLLGVFYEFYGNGVIPWQNDNTFAIGSWLYYNTAAESF